MEGPWELGRGLVNFHDLTEAVVSWRGKGTYSAQKHWEKRMKMSIDSYSITQGKQGRR